MPSSLVEEIEQLYEFWTQPTGKIEFLNALDGT
jgi:hypothetical protein